ncbi:unnamed protein product [Ixodes persulcatus]
MIVAHRPIACRPSFYLSKLSNLDWMRSGRIRVNAAPFRDPRNRSKFPDSVAKKAASAAPALGDSVSLKVEDILNKVTVFGFGLEERRASSASYPEIWSRRLETSLVIAVFLSFVSGGKCAPSNKPTLMLYPSPIFKRQCIEGYIFSLERVGSDGNCGISST